jgi:hypothetical protein
METHRQLMQRRAQIVDQIGALGPMRMGSICEQYLPTHRKDGSVSRRGPYLTYTFKQGGKTRGKHLRSQAEAQLYRQQIEAFRRYQELSGELVQISQRLADQEVSGEAGCKKNSRN